MSFGPRQATSSISQAQPSTGASGFDKGAHALPPAQTETASCALNWRRRSVSAAMSSPSSGRLNGANRCWASLAVNRLVGRVSSRT